MKTVKEISNVLRDFTISLEEVDEYVENLTEQEAKNVLKKIASCWERVGSK